MRGQLFLFQNPIMKLKPEQQEICRLNFDAVKRRLKQTDHHFRHDALMNAVECMIIDFFDFHAQLYPITMPTNYVSHRNISARSARR